MALIASTEKRHTSWLPSTDWWYCSPRLLMTFPTALQHMMKRKRDRTSPCRTLHGSGLREEAQLYIAFLQLTSYQRGEPEGGFALLLPPQHLTAGLQMQHMHTHQLPSSMRSLAHQNKGYKGWSCYIKDCFLGQTFQFHTFAWTLFNTTLLTMETHHESQGTALCYSAGTCLRFLPGSLTAVNGNGMEASQDGV